MKNDQDEKEREREMRGLYSSFFSFFEILVIAHFKNCALVVIIIWFLLLMMMMMMLNYYVNLKLREREREKENFHVLLHGVKSINRNETNKGI